MQIIYQMLLFERIAILHHVCNREDNQLINRHTVDRLSQRVIQTREKKLED